MVNVKKQLIMVGVCLLVLISCDSKSKKEAQRQEHLEQLVSQICNGQTTRHVKDDKNILIECAENNRTYDMVFYEDKYDITYTAKLPETVLSYSKYGENIEAIVNGDWSIDSRKPNLVEVYLHVVAGAKQDQQFDMVVDLRTADIYRIDPVTRERGNELEFIESLHEALLSHARTAVVDINKPFIEKYGSLYQIQNILLQKNTTELREDVYELPFSVTQVLHMQFPVEEKDDVLYERKSNYFQFDLANQRVIVNTCESECDYKLTQYDIKNDVVIYYPGTLKEVVIDPNTCTTEKFCEVSKTIKTSVISTIAFQSRVAPLRQSLDYNEQFTRGNMEELNKYLAGIMKQYHPS